MRYERLERGAQYRAGQRWWIFSSPDAFSSLSQEASGSIANSEGGTFGLQFTLLVLNVRNGGT